MNKDKIIEELREEILSLTAANISLKESCLTLSERNRELADMVEDLVLSTER